MTRPDGERKKWSASGISLSRYDNLGFPYIEVVDGEYDGNSELYLTHRYEGSSWNEVARKTMEDVTKAGVARAPETQVDEESLSCTTTA